MNKLIFALSLVILGTQVHASDDPVIAEGKKLHNEKCLSCHSTDVYTREDRKINSLEALTQQVNFCMKGPAKADWTVSETNAVIEYLNIRFYRF